MMNKIQIKNNEVENIKELLDETIISKAKSKNDNLLYLVIDMGVETVLFFPFEKEEEIDKACNIDACTGEDYLDSLFILFPDLKSVAPSYPYGEAGDLIHIRLMDGKEFITNEIKWVISKNGKFSFIPYANESILDISDVRFMHIYYTKETFVDDSNELVEELARMSQMISMHLKHFLTRQVKSVFTSK